MPLVLAALLCSAGIAVATVALPGPAALRLALGTVGIGAAALMLWLRRRMHRGSQDVNAPQRELVLHGGILSVEGGGQAVELLATLRSGYGMSLLTSARRDVVVVALTTPERTTFIGAELSPPDLRHLDVLLARAVTASRDDLRAATLLPSGTHVQIDVTDLLWLVDALLRSEPGALDRCFLSDANGDCVVLDRHELRTSRGVFRLDQPFEWRALRFHEGSETAYASFQGTWLRQGKDEVVLVALLGGVDVRASIFDLPAGWAAKVDTDALLDARLCECSPGPPPPADKRVAVDRLFMLPLRRAIDRACTETSHSIPGDASAR
jgi:hypothetical protein